MMTRRQTQGILRYTPLMHVEQSLIGAFVKRGKRER
jgi:hypothetical protein